MVLLLKLVNRYRRNRSIKSNLSLIFRYIPGISQEPFTNQIVASNGNLRSFEPQEINCQLIIKKSVIKINLTRFTILMIAYRFSTELRKIILGFPPRNISQKANPISPKAIGALKIISAVFILPSNSGKMIFAL